MGEAFKGQRDALPPGIEGDRGPMQRPGASKGMVKHTGVKGKERLLVLTTSEHNNSPITSLIHLFQRWAVDWGERKLSFNIP